MRRLLCTLLGHKFGPAEPVMGVEVRRCHRCGHAASGEGAGRA